MGYPVRCVATGGERNDITHANALTPAGTEDQVVCDRGYDADWWRDRLVAADHQSVIQGRHSRLVPPYHKPITPISIGLSI